MNKALILATRAKLEGKNLLIIMDNSYTVETNRDGKSIIWDDSAEVIYAIKINQNYNSQDKYPYILEVYGYDEIQMISAIVTNEDIDTLISGISGAIGVQQFNKCREAYNKKL